MKRPNKTGCVLKLSGKRRRPYAVRLWDGTKLNNKGQIVPKYKYIAYFEKSGEALSFLEKYNQSPVELVKKKEKETKHKFSEIYEMWLDDLSHRNKQLSKQTYDSYQAAYKNLSPLHNMVFENILLEDLEKAARANSHKSLSSISNIRVVLKGMYKTAIRHRFVSEDISQLIIVEHNNEKSRPHTPFTQDEIAILWEHKDEEMIKLVLMLIYTGMRVRELLNLESKNVHLDDRYLIGGSKTEAGIARTIPISDKIVPLFDLSHKYVFTLEGKKVLYNRARLLLEPILKDLHMEHSFHDTRHTCSTLMEKAQIPLLHRKLILGHRIDDITDHYTHVEISDLIKDINLI